MMRNNRIWSLETSRKISPVELYLGRIVSELWLVASSLLGTWSLVVVVDWLVVVAWHHHQQVVGLSEAWWIGGCGRMIIIVCGTETVSVVLCLNCFSYSSRSRWRGFHFYGLKFLYWAILNGSGWAFYSFSLWRCTERHLQLDIHHHQQSASECGK